MKTVTSSDTADANKAKPESIKCLIVVPSLVRAGAETQAVDLANGLVAKGHEVHLSSFESQLDQLERVSDGVRFHHIQRRSKYDRSLISRLAELIDEEEIQVAQGVLQFATLVLWLASERSRGNPPVIGAVHTTINRGIKQELFDRFVYRSMMRRLARIVFVCEQQRDHWIRRYPEIEASSTVVHNGVRPERFRREEFLEAGRQLRNDLDLPADAFIFSCIAAFRKEKGQRLLLEAFREVSQQSFLVFAGDGQLREEVEQYAASLGMVNSTRFLGNIPDTRPLIAASNVTVLASTAVETFSMAMLESMAMGVPMIAPRIGGLAEAISHDITGMLFPIGDSAALASCMRTVVRDRLHAEKMGVRAKDRVVENFTFSKMIAATENVMISVIKRY